MHPERDSMFPPSCRHGLLKSDWRIIWSEMILFIISGTRRNAHTGLTRKSERQIAELRAIQDKGLQFAVPVAYMRKPKKQPAEVPECDVQGVKTAAQLLEEQAVLIFIIAQHYQLLLNANHNSPKGNASRKISV
ncbi:unnamed protein product [Strongylus vulgaris]|uniref:Uncharacterized protein n=1 Tax=Strongylus vulgaris TaxID=40348 RepID=A0A3P7J886_STRVU|nr:unnamed protein product [Strongylus vulgaris]